MSEIVHIGPNYFKLFLTSIKFIQIGLISILFLFQEGDPHASDLSIGGNETNLQCDICGKKCRDKKHYRNHILHHKYFKKDLPDSEPQSKEDIKQFGNLAHSEDDSLRCPDCGKICKDKSHFKNHKLHHKFLKNAERIDCEKCNKVSSVIEFLSWSKF